MLEETGVETEFDSVLAFWHGHRGLFGKSDLFFVVRMRLKPGTDPSALRPQVCKVFAVGVTHRRGREGGREGRGGCDTVVTLTVYIISLCLWKRTRCDIRQALLHCAVRHAVRAAVVTGARQFKGLNNVCCFSFSEYSWPKPSPWSQTRHIVVLKRFEVSAVFVLFCLIFFFQL